MDLSGLKKLAQLKSLTTDIERSIGLYDMGETERSILAAAADCADDNNIVRTSEIMEHKCVAHISRPTFFRVIKKLVNDDFLLHAPEEKVGYYQLKASNKATVSA